MSSGAIRLWMTSRRFRRVMRAIFPPRLRGFRRTQWRGKRSEKLHDSEVRSGLLDVICPAWRTGHLPGDPVALRDRHHHADSSQRGSRQIGRPRLGRGRLHHKTIHACPN